MLRKVFITLTLLLWLTTILISLEAFARWSVHRHKEEIDTFVEEALRAGSEADAEYVSMHPASPSAPPAELAPARDTFYESSGEAHRALAEQRQEIILECNEEGVILSSYIPASSSLSPTMQSLVVKVEARKSIFDLLSPTQTDDARAGLGTELDSRGFFYREYWVPTGAEHEKYLFEFFFDRKKRDDAEAAFTLWIQDSIWEKQGIKFKPNIRRKGLFSSDVFVTNAQGFRDFEVVLPKPPGVYRILCIGGSTTFEGPRTDLTYPKMFERMLREHFMTDRIEVVNCGVVALDSTGERERIPDYLALEPDLIIHYNFVNDLYGRLFGSMYPYTPVFRPLRWIWWKMKDSALIFNYFPRLYLPPKAVFLEQVRTVTMDNLRTLGHEAQRHGAAVALCSFAYPHIEKHDRLARGFFDQRVRLSLGDMRLGALQYGRYAQVYAQQVQHLCKTEGWHYIPVAENIQAGTEHFSDIFHMYCSGMELKASVIFREIRVIVAGELNSEADSDFSSQAWRNLLQGGGVGPIRKTLAT